jgi:hypothetical protein
VRAISFAKGGFAAQHSCGTCSTHVQAKLGDIDAYIMLMAADEKAGWSEVFTAPKTASSQAAREELLLAAQALS